MSHRPTPRRRALGRAAHRERVRGVGRRRRVPADLPVHARHRGRPRRARAARHPPRRRRVAAPPCPTTCAPGPPSPRRSPTRPSREGVAPDEVVIAAWTPVTWNDGSLGCPEKGMAYTQALVDGELLLLRVGTGLFQYHAGRGGSFAYCADPSATYTVRG